LRPDVSRGYRARVHAWLLAQARPDWQCGRWCHTLGEPEQLGISRDMLGPHTGDIDRVVKTLVMALAIRQDYLRSAVHAPGGNDDITGGNVLAMRTRAAVVEERLRPLGSAQRRGRRGGVDEPNA